MGTAKTHLKHKHFRLDNAKLKRAQTVESRHGDGNDRSRPGPCDRRIQARSLGAGSESALSFKRGLDRGCLRKAASLVAQNFLDAARCLARAVFVLDEGETNIALSFSSKAGTGRDGDKRFLKQ